MVEKEIEKKKRIYLKIIFIFLVVNGLSINVMFCLVEYHSVSMGQGQEVHARRLLSQSLQNGDWLLLQNCHLSLDYVLECLDVLIETEHLHDLFRLWITSEEHPKFPISFLQACLLYISFCGIIRISSRT